MIDESMMRSPLPPWTKRQSSGWFPREIARTGSVQHRMKNGDFMVPLIYETYGNFIQILYLDDLDVQFFGVFPNISHIFHGILYLDESGFCMFLFVDDKKYQWGHPIGPTLLIGYPLTSAWIYKSKLQYSNYTHRWVCPRGPHHDAPRHGSAGTQGQHGRALCDLLRMTVLGGGQGGCDCG